MTTCIMLYNRTHKFNDFLVLSANHISTIRIDDVLGVKPTNKSHQTYLYWLEVHSFMIIYLMNKISKIIRKLMNERELKFLSMDKKKNLFHLYKNLKPIRQFSHMFVKQSAKCEWLSL